MNIGGRAIVQGESPFLIAEVGISHGGSRQLALQSVEMALDAGFDAVKFQHYHQDITFPTGGGEREDRFRKARLADIDIERLKAETEDLGGIFICA